MMTLTEFAELEYETNLTLAGTDLSEAEFDQRDLDLEEAFFERLAEDDDEEREAEERERADQETKWQSRYVG